MVLKFFTILKNIFPVLKPKSIHYCECSQFILENKTTAFLFSMLSKDSMVAWGIMCAVCNAKYLRFQTSEKQLA